MLNFIMPKSSQLGGGLILLLLILMPSCRGEGQTQEGQSSASPESASRALSATQMSGSWPEVNYAEIRAYYSSQPFEDFFIKDGIPQHVDPKRGVLLDADQKRRLVAAVNARIEPHDVFGCWEPHHAFVFYDPLGKAVAEFDICFRCFVTMGYPYFEDYPDLPALADLVSDLGLPIGPSGVDAASFRKGFNEFTKATAKVSGE